MHGYGICMVISLRKLIRPLIGVVVLLTLVFTLWSIFHNRPTKFVMDGYVHNDSMLEQEFTQLSCLHC